MTTLCGVGFARGTAGPVGLQAPFDAYSSNISRDSGETGRHCKNIARKCCEQNESAKTARTRQFADHRFKEFLSAINKNAILFLGLNVRAGFVWRTVEFEDAVV